MDMTHNVDKFFHILKWFSEAKLLYPNISKDKEVGFLFPDACKNQIIWNYAFGVFEEKFII